MRKLFLAVACLVPLWAAGQSVHRCVDDSGKITFTDKACGAREQQEAVDLPPVPKTPYQRRMDEAAERDAVYKARMKEWEVTQGKWARVRQEKCSARRRQEGLSIGMTKEDLEASPHWGMPTDTTTHRTAAGLTEYLVYECEGEESVRIYVRNGVVDSIHQ